MFCYVVRQKTIRGKGCTRRMYRKNSNSWLKHWDFIILDLVALQLAYVSSFVLRMGINDLDHNGLYLNIGIFIALVDICTAFFTEPYHGIMRRGYFVEFKNVLKHVFIVSALVIVYLFMSKQGSMTSRLVIHSNGSGSALCGANRMEEIFAETWQYALCKNEHASRFNKL